MVAAVARIVSSYVAGNPLPHSELPALIASVHRSLAGVAAPTTPPPGPPKPAVPIRSSVKPDRIFCLEDGKPFKSLKRHLRAQYNMSPEQYREKWNLPADYPMVAPDYAQKRSTLARNMGLGSVRRGRGSARQKSPP